MATTNGTIKAPRISKAAMDAAQAVVDAPKGTTVVVKAPNIMRAEFRLVGTAPLVMNKFSAKAFNQMRATQEAGETAKNKKKREPKDFDKCYEDAMRISHEGWHGIHAGGFRNALISACKICGFPMTRAKLSLFVMAAGFDKDDSQPLVKITRGKPTKFEMPVRNDNGSCDIRARPLWQPGWECNLRIQWDGDQFKVEDITNLLMRVGLQVGIGEGRPDSSNSNGMGWGLFSVEGRK